MAEWLMAPVLKTGVPERVPGVRIPPSPPDVLSPVSIVVYLTFPFASITSPAVSEYLRGAY